MIPRTSDVGVIVGRFQVHRLHEAHLALIKSVYDTHPQTVIILGLSPVRVTARNPLDFEARKQMLLEAFPKATVFYINDEPYDEKWSQRLDEMIKTYVRPTGTATLYGGRDSFIDHYTGKYQVAVLEPETYASGTEMRRGIARAVKSTEDFRAGVIWASANAYPKVFPTVDVAIWRATTQAKDAATPEKEWLLVRKPNEDQWRFCGGFVDPTDLSFELAAHREVQEETGVEIAAVHYVASVQIDDWRYRDEADKIITTFYTAQFVFGPVRPADDVAAARWFTSEQLNGPDPVIVREHYPLWRALPEGWVKK